MTEYSSEGAPSPVIENQNRVRGDLKTSTFPPLVGIPAGIFSTFIITKFPDRGFLSSEYYIGKAFEFQLLVFLSFLLGTLVIFLESKRFNISLKEMFLGALICTIISIMVAYGWSILPLLWIFYLQWLWMCYFWPKKLIPPFRYAIWLSLGLICGAIAGSIIGIYIF